MPNWITNNVKIIADENHKQIFRITQEMIDQVDNLAEIIETELVRIVNI